MAPLILSKAITALCKRPELHLVTQQLCLQPSIKYISPLPRPLYTKHLDIDPSPLSDRTRVISSPKNTSTDVNLIMCWRKSQETNGEKGINSSQLAAAQHLMLTLKLRQKKSVKCLSIKKTGRVLFCTVLVFQTIQIYHGEVIMKRMIVGDWLLEHTYVSLQTLMWADK